MEELRLDKSFLRACLDGYAQMAIDEALLELRSRNEVCDWLRLWRFCPSAVSIGYFQRVSRVVNVEEVEKLGIHLVRRFTGGGAVYHDQRGEVVYSVALEVRGELSDVAKSFEIVCGAIVEALRELGIEDVSFKPLNDVVVKGRKISGSAQARRFGETRALLQHGTLLVSTDLSIMERVLKPPIEKLRGYGVARVRDAVIRLVDVVGEVPLEKIVDALIAGFERALRRHVIEDSLPSKVLELAKKLEPRFRSREWVYSRV